MEGRDPRGSSPTQEALLRSPAHNPNEPLRRGGWRVGQMPLMLTLIMAATVCVLLWAERDVISATLLMAWRDLLFWAMLIALVNFIHMDLEPLQFTLDMPLLLATALLYPPPVAALVALTASVDVREFRRTVTISRAIYNRCQIGVSVFAAGLTYQAVGLRGEHWSQAIAGTALAMGVFYSLNAAFVAMYASARSPTSPLQVLRRLAIGRPLQYALTYLGYGMLGLVLARLFNQVGTWSVVLLLIPIIVAHAALVRAEKLRSLANRLRARERLLELLSDRIADERKDERLRIASDLHDDILQSLIRMSQLGYFLRRATPDGTQASNDAMELFHTSQETIQSLREVVGDLRKSPVGRGGLVRTLRSLARDLRIEWQVPISVEGPAEIHLPAEVQVAGYLCAKEGILNALKHAHASAIDVRIQLSSSALHVDIKDDGQGFRTDRVDESSHFGLGLMRERVSMQGGSLAIDSNLGGGTHLSIVIPAPQPTSGTLSENPSDVETIPDVR